MGTKTLTIMDDAYELLKARKKNGDSFSDVIRREFGPRDLLELAGILSPKQADELENNIKEARKLSRGRADRIARELNNDL